MHVRTYHAGTELLCVQRLPQQVHGRQCLLLKHVMTHTLDCCTIMRDDHACGTVHWVLKPAQHRLDQHSCYLLFAALHICPLPLQTCNASAKQTIASTQQQRQALRQALQEMQQAFIADCVALHSHAAVLLGELRCRNLAGLEGALPEEFGLADASGDAAAYVTAAAGGKAGAGAANALAGKQQQLMFEPRQAEEEWCGMGDAAALLYSGGLLQCGGGAAEHQLQHD